MLSTISRWMQCKELKNDLNAVRSLPPEAKRTLLDYIGRAATRVEMEHRLPVFEILESESYHSVENAQWAQAAIIINNGYRQPLLQKARAGDNTAMFMQLPYGIILHSIRATLDFELRGNKEMTLLCQSLWYYLADGNQENIPARFRKKE